ncbi:hypothetical protein ABEF91_005445 [Exophiala dermatitidis]
MVNNLVDHVFGYSLADPEHPWNQRGYKAHLAKEPRSPSEDPYGEKAYQRAFAEDISRRKPFVPCPAYYVNSPSAMECQSHRDRELFAPREWTPESLAAQKRYKPEIQPQYLWRPDLQYSPQQLQQLQLLVQSKSSQPQPPPPPQQQPQPQPQHYQQPPQTPSYHQPVTPTMEQQPGPHPDEMLPSPKYRDETPRSANKKTKRDHNKSISSTSSSGPRPWNKRQDPQPITPKPLLPAAIRPSPHQEPASPAQLQMPVTDSAPMSIAEQYPPSPDQYRLSHSEQYPPGSSSGQNRMQVAPEIPCFLEPRVEPSLGPPRMLR